MPLGKARFPSYFVVALAMHKFFFEKLIPDERERWPDSGFLTLSRAC